MSHDFDADRERLVRDLEGRGIHDTGVLQALRDIPRHAFVPDDLRHAAYDDRALPIGEAQTISQPYMVALMTQELALNGKQHVLEIGTGSGYQTALLSRLSRDVVSLERLPELSRSARQRLKELGYDNIEFHVGDGTLGWPAAAPYDRILVAAGSPEVPPELIRQLVPGGRLVIPVGRANPLKLQTIVLQPEGPLIVNVCDCSFVPLVGAEGWAENTAYSDD